MSEQHDAHLNALFRRKWNEEKDNIMWQSMDASKRAMSWRKFDVGCALLAYRANATPENRWGVFVGANVKVTQDARPVCAEMTAILAAYHSGYDRIVGLSVFGKPQDEADRESGVKPKRLHPCPDCRKTMSRLPIVAQDTMLLCVKVGMLEGEDLAKFEQQMGEKMYHAHGISTEEMTFAELLAVHAGTNGNGK